MILAVDVGNTTITLGGFDRDELSFVARISTDISMTSDEYAAKILSVLSLYGVDKSTVIGAAMSSVVPPLNSVIKNAIKFLYGLEPVTVGPGVKTGINIRCDNPTSVGSDIICSCVAAHFLYSSPSIIVDLGTATKITAVGKNGGFSGVSILPGVLMGLRALSDETSQLPQVSFERPMSVIGKNTADSMRSGAFYGNAAMIDGMIDRFCEEIGEIVPVYATGGYAPFIVPHCKHDIIVDEFMVLRGLNIIYNKNTK